MAINIRKSIQKNLPEAIAFATGRMPSFVYGFRHFKDIPVFCFHSARYPLFEEQLLFLKRNGYRTLSADELYERRCDSSYRNDGKEIVLTFDDGMASLWTVAFPLLQKYEFKIVSFILPGLTEDASDVGVTISDVSESDRSGLADRDFGEHPLCNWKEIEAMHESGLVDFQSHGMYHELISISPKIVDFVHPDFDLNQYGNIHIPIYADDETERSRERVLGHPIYESAPRFTGRARYFDPPGLRKSCAEFVASSGGAQFFAKEDWRTSLTDFVSQQDPELGPDTGGYESPAAIEEAMKADLIDSKKALESRLPGKSARHFCVPWFQSCNRGAELVLESGYSILHLGAVPGFSKRAGSDYPVFVTRLQEEYLLRLPGDESISMIKVLSLKKSMRKSGATRE
jgi:peptidoglycan/xylan/chitin deacetylase (PgdA/CDA1 family)